MRRSRWLAGWKGSATKPVIYHCISRVVDRRFVFEERECEAFRMYMRMYENFSGCRVLSYCVMSNHFHLLLEVPPMVDGGLSDEELLGRLGGLYSEVVVAGVAAELAEARKTSIGADRHLASHRQKSIDLSRDECYGHSLCAQCLIKNGFTDPSLHASRAAAPDDSYVPSETPTTAGRNIAAIPWWHSLCIGGT